MAARMGQQEARIDQLKVENSRQEARIDQLDVERITLSRSFLKKIPECPVNIKLYFTLSD